MARDLYVCLGPVGRAERCPQLSDQRRCPKHRTRRALGFDEQYDRNRPIVLMRDRYTCQLRLPGCTTRATTVDHVVPRSEGGKSLMSNLVAACGSCNRAKSNQLT